MQTYILVRGHTVMLFNNLHIELQDSVHRNPGYSLETMQRLGYTKIGVL